ncbi:MAG TPA: hypothetical protein PLZ43_11615 [bacterium]|nr:hypothetical protein [bacterium]
MERKIEQKINKALDIAITKFQSDPDIIYLTEKDGLKLKYFDQDKLKKWKKNKLCIHSNCNRKSILKSHTIQKSTAIKSISEDGHVLTPNFNQRTGKLEMISIGINDASTFPGFCEEHEKLFEEFESQKDLICEDHFVLQIYRTVCREIVITEYMLKEMISASDRYVKYRDEKIKEIFISEIGSDFLIQNNIKNIELRLKNGDNREKLVKGRVSSLKKYLKLLKTLKNAIISDIKNKKFQKMDCIAIKIDVVFPVCIAGKSNFYIKPKRKIKNVDVIYNVLPYKDKTYIIICSLKKHALAMNLYMKQFGNPLGVIGLIERWMVYGSDHWFIKPSVWKNLDVDRQVEILKDIRDTSKNIGNDCKYSIFDDLRKAMINTMDENYHELSESLIKLLENERKKMICVNGIE